MFVFVPVFTLHLSGDLAGPIEDLNTLIGIGLFLLLWTTTCYCTLCAWMQIGVSRLRSESPSLGRMLLYGAKWGALDGYTFALALVAAFLVGIGAIYLVEVGPVSLISIAVLGGIGMAFGALVGMVLGATFGMIAALIVTPLIRLAPVLLDEQGPPLYRRQIS